MIYTVTCANGRPEWPLVLRFPIKFHGFLEFHGFLILNSTSYLFNKTSNGMEISHKTARNIST